MTTPVVHPDVPKPAVGYKFANPDITKALLDPEACKRCSMWRPDSAFPLVGVCTEVIGPIFAGGTCRDFDPA